MAHINLNRISRVQGLMDELNVDYLLVGPTSNMFYLTGKKTVADERLQLIIIPKKGTPVILLPEMYREKFRELELGGFFKLKYWKDNENPYSQLRLALAQRASKVAVDEQLWAGHFLNIMDYFGKAEYIGASGILGVLKICKDPAEIELMLAAGKIIDKVMSEMIDLIKPGITERKLAHIIEKQIQEAGADDIAFKPIVASGSNSALPHHSPTDRELQAGEFVVVDFGAVYKGYCSDMTRTFFLGKANSRQREIYNVVKAAYEAGYREAVKGKKIEDLDLAVRNVIARAGYGKYFIHRTGHGIGIEVHEDPYIMEGNANLLENGMAFSIEPGIYIPGEFGIRLENIVVVNDASPRELNKFHLGSFELEQ